MNRAILAANKIGTLAAAMNRATSAANKIGTLAGRAMSIAILAAAASRAISVAAVKTGT